MKRTLLVTLLSIGTVISSAVAAFVYSSSIEADTNIMIVVASYSNFISNTNSNINIDGEFKLIIKEEIETYCTINATCINKNNDYIGSYYFSWDDAFDSYFDFTNFKGNFKNGIIIDSPFISWKKNINSFTNEDYYKMESDLKNKDIKITFNLSNNQ